MEFVFGVSTILSVLILLTPSVVLRTFPAERNIVWPELYM
jgi:hypothetical protein